MTALANTCRKAAIAPFSTAPRWRHTIRTASAEFPGQLRLPKRGERELGVHGAFLLLLRIQLWTFHDAIANLAVWPPERAD